MITGQVLSILKHGYNSIWSKTDDMFVNYFFNYGTNHPSFYLPSFSYGLVDFTHLLSLFFHSSNTDFVPSASNPADAWTREENFFLLKSWSTELQYQLNLKTKIKPSLTFCRARTIILVYNCVILSRTSGAVLPGRGSNVTQLASINSYVFLLLF